ncbi:MAG: hypothetical protein ACI90V_014129 [Bacillariaceae sp.]|jgi:hypothetical protein
MYAFDDNTARGREKKRYILALLYVNRFPAIRNFVVFFTVV